jgi:MATE family multidrug resistance protein
MASHPSAAVAVEGVEVASAARGSAREVAWLAVPVVLQNLSHTLLHVVDTAIVGGLGPNAIGAVGYGGIWIWTAQCLFLGIASGVQSFVSQAHGAGRERECGPWIWQAVYAVVPAITAVVVAFALAFPALLELLGPAPELREPATAYVRARALGVVAVSFGLVLHSFLRGIGDMRTPLVVTVIENVFNAALAYGLVYGVYGLPELGVAGAGIATACAETLYAVLLLAVVLRGPLRRAFATGPVRADLAAIRRFVRTSGAIGGQWFLDMITFALFSTLIARMGSASMAASQSFVVLLHFAFMQVIGVQIACATLVGRYIGARDLEAAARSYRSAVGLGLCLAAVVSAVFCAIPGPLLRIFTDDASVLELGRPLLFVGAVFNLFDALAIVASGALRGAGDTRFAFWVQTLIAWVVYLPSAYLLGVVLEGGLLGAWIGASTYSFALSAALALRFRAGAWRTVRI